MKKSKVFYTNARALHYRYEYSLPAKYKALIVAPALGVIFTKACL